VGLFGGSNMKTKNLKCAATLALLGMSQFGCYNTYFITTQELQKLESSVEHREVVEVYGDCPGTASLPLPTGKTFAESEPQTAATATDAATPSATEAGESTGISGCEKVAVSTGNAVNILTSEGERRRVTPFNFIMNGGQLVSPEYDLLMRLDNVQGAEVSEFSAWKTIGTALGVTGVAVGTFVGISLLAPEGQGFQK
jgi:hypothetical protein